MGAQTYRGRDEGRGRERGGSKVIRTFYMNVGRRIRGRNMNGKSVVGTLLVIRVIEIVSQRTQPETGRKQVDESYRTIGTDSGRYVDETGRKRTGPDEYCDVNGKRVS